MKLKYTFALAIFLICCQGISREILHTSKFNFDKHQLIQTEKDALHAALHHVDSNFLLELRAYTDQIGSAEYNIALSKKRALFIKNFLIDKIGLNPDKIKAVGAGEDTSQASNAHKRRVDIIIYAPKALENESTTTNENNKSVVEFEGDSQDESALEVYTSGDKDYSRPSEKADSNRYFIGLGLYQNVLNAEDNNGPGLGTNSEWISKLNFKFLGAYQIKLKEHLWIGLEGNIEVQDYEIEVDNVYVWDEKNPILYGITFITDYERSNFGLGFGLKYGNEPFIHERNNNVTLELSNVLSVELRSKYKFYNSKNYSSTAGLSIGQALFSSGFLEPEGKIGGMAYIDLNKKNWFKDHEINFRLYYGLKNFTNNRNDQTDEFGGFQVRYRNKKWL